MAKKSIYLTLGNKLDVLKFELLFSKHKNDAQKIHDELIRVGFDDLTMGFWIWDIPNMIEIYSPNFRRSLGFEGEHDFPNLPDSWQTQITAKSLDLALKNYVKHVESRGHFPYEQLVTYRKKKSGTVDLHCMGQVVSWDGDDPQLMIGAHKHPE